MSLTRKMLKGMGLTEEQANAILSFIEISGTNAQVLEALEQFRGKNELFDTGLEELVKLAADLEGIAADIRRATDEKENEDNNTLFELRPDYGEVLK